jgi:hypothetical protein
MSAFISLPGVQLTATPRVDSMPDLGAVVIYPASDSVTHIQVSDLAVARAHAAAWAQAVQLLEAQQGGGQ